MMMFTAGFIIGSLVVFVIAGAYLIHVWDREGYGTHRPFLRHWRFSQGLKQAGFPISKTYFSEVDKYAISVYQKQFQKPNISES